MPGDPKINKLQSLFCRDLLSGGIDGKLTPTMQDGRSTKTRLCKAHARELTVLSRAEVTGIGVQQTKEEAERSSLRA